MNKDLKTIRLSKSMSQSDVARAIGVSLMTYQLWERDVMNPNPGNRKKLFEVLEIKE